MADCFCGAVGYVLCTECGGDDAGCWRCRHDHDDGTNGMIPASPGDQPDVIVHEDI